MKSRRHQQGDPDNVAMLRKQHEVMIQVLANLVATKLQKSGCLEEDLLNFTAEIMQAVYAAGFGSNGGSHSRIQGEAHQEPIVDVFWSCKIMREQGHVIHGERVTLRPLDRVFVDLLDAWRSEPWIRKTLGTRFLDDLIHRPENADELRFDYLIHDEQDQAVGLASLFHVDDEVGQAEIAKLVGDPHALGRGYAGEAMSLLLTYAFMVLKLQRVYLQTSGLNLYNITLNTKLGFRFEGILRASMILDEDVIDVVRMSMLASEFFDRYRPRQLTRFSSQQGWAPHETISNLA